MMGTALERSGRLPPARRPEALQRSRYSYLMGREGAYVLFNALTLEVFQAGREEVEAWRKYERPRPPDGTAEVDRLFAAGLLVSPEDNRPGAVTRRLISLRQAALRNKGARVGFLRVSLTDSCNMACGYCFQRTFSRDQEATLRRERFEDIIRWLVEQNRGATPEVQYFGGEPLLRTDLVRLGNKILLEARASGHIAGYRQTLTTNGTLLTPELVEFLVENEISATFSLDGPREVNDRWRVLRSGKGCYDAVVRGLTLYLRAGGRPAVLITAWRDTVNSLPESIRFLVEKLGVESVGVNAPQPTAERWEVNGEDLARAVQQAWAYCSARGVTFQAPGTYLPSRLAAKLPQFDSCVDFRLGSTSSHWPLYVTAKGEASLCLVYHGPLECSFPDPTAIPDDALRRWHYGSTLLEVCDSCPAGLLCGGPCSLELTLSSGRLNADRCRYFRSMTEWVVTQ